MDSDHNLTEGSSSSFGIVGTKLDTPVAKTPAQKHKQYQTGVLYLKNELELKKKELTKLETELTNEKRGRQQDFQKLTEDNIRLTVELERCKQYIKGLENEIHLLEAKVLDQEKCQGRADRSKNEEALQQRIAELTKQVKALRTNLKEVGAIGGTNTTVAAKLQDLTEITKADNAALKEENELMRAEVTSLKDEVTNMNNNVVEMKNVMKDLVNKLVVKDNRQPKRKWTRSGKSSESNYRV